MFRRLIVIFLGALVLNLIWEHFHSALYVSYKGGAVTNVILFRASLFDAAVITLFSFPFLQFEWLKQRHLLLYVALVVFAVALEKWALATGRWVYADTMPLIPLLHVGLTPMIQLGILGYLTLLISDFCKKTGSRESVSLEQSDEL